MILPGGMILMGVLMFQDTKWYLLILNTQIRGNLKFTLS